MYKKAYAMPNPAAPSRVVTIDPDLCKSCNTCVKWCRCGVLIPNTTKGAPPVVLYPDECWFCGMCVEGCPVDGAITLQHPLNQRIGFKDSETGELYRMGRDNGLPANTRPVVKG